MGGHLLFRRGSRPDGRSVVMVPGGRAWRRARQHVVDVLVALVLLKRELAGLRRVALMTLRNQQALIDGECVANGECSMVEDSDSSDDSDEEEEEIDEAMHSEGEAYTPGGDNAVKAWAVL